MAAATPRPPRPAIHVVGRPSRLMQAHPKAWDMSGIDDDIAFLRRSTVFDGRYRPQPAPEEAKTHPALVLLGIFASSIVLWLLIIAAIVFAVTR